MPRPTLESQTLKARDLQERFDALRAVVEAALEAHAAGDPPEAIFGGLRKELERVPAGRWDIESCIDKAHEWTELHGAPPAALEWNPAGIKARTGGDRDERRQEMLGRWLEGDWPSTATIQRLFGSWNGFLVQAGFEPRKPGDERRGARNGAGRGLDHLPEWTGWEVVSGYRERAGLSQSRLAERAGVSIEYVGYIERGRQTNPSIRVLLALARALQVAPAVLVDVHMRDGR